MKHIFRVSAPPGTQIDSFDNIYLSQAQDNAITRFQNLRFDTQEDRSSIPIEEERMETIKYAGSSPWNVTSWFFQERHDENAI